MATKSITKNVDIRSKHLGRAFVSALENAKNKSSQKVIVTKTVETIHKDQIKSLFGSHR